MEQLWNDMRTTVCETLGIEQAPVTVNPEEDEVDSRVQSLSEELDIDALNDDFKKFAGVDGMLSRAEFNTFIKMKQIPSAVAGVLWSLLDRDNSGEVSKDEFKSALLALRNSQSWSRYCPACEYRNECAFCQECNSGCPRCSDNSFCASCWNDHPGRQQTMEEQALLALFTLFSPLCTQCVIYARHTHCTHHTHRSAPAAPAAPSVPSAPPYAPVVPEQDNQDREPHPFGSTEYLRENVLIRPLEWAYNSRALRGLPVQYKAGMRQMLADQKQKADAAAKEAQAAAAAD